jgi:hypothetical protein
LQGITKFTQGNRLVKKIGGEAIKMLVRLTLNDNETNLTVPNERITKVEVATADAHVQLNRFLIKMNENGKGQCQKQLKNYPNFKKMFKFGFKIKQCNSLG